ncbi:alpha/beta hydrolase [Lentibacter algarum]|uniref:alpha/beta hydrolase n=1 Tax=Lentibacter algarum TaxID=576131 RepID=UPI001C08251D|nr:alpha/beta hydrolase [Lentibacter algarum]MBU2983498.1 alpha/beta hydrolase [Lentibacter algarum]
MSLSLRALVMNQWLRLTEKTHLARTSDVNKLRSSFEFKAKHLFRKPAGTVSERTTLGGRPALNVSVPNSRSSKVILYFHGGAYVMGSAKTHHKMLAVLCGFARSRAILVDYRLAPENVFPAPVEDAISAYKALLTTTDPLDIILGGDSAGGGIVLALLGEICRLKLPQPAGVFALSPLTDVTFSGASIIENKRSDVVLPAERIQDLQGLYMLSADPKDPRASPLFADFAGACPVWIAASDSEILLDDSQRMAERLRNQGVVVTETIAHNMPHVWPMFHNYFPEAKRSLKAIAIWINSLSAPSPES